MEAMTPEHPKWEEFIGILEGPEGCNFREVDGTTLWDCAAGNSKEHAHRILGDFKPPVDVWNSLRYFDTHGGYCDCEIIFNVDHLNNK